MGIRDSEHGVPHPGLRCVMVTGCQILGWDGVYEVVRRTVGLVWGSGNITLYISRYVWVLGALDYGGTGVGAQPR